MYDPPHLHNRASLRQRQGEVRHGQAEIRRRGPVDTRLTAPCSLQPILNLLLLPVIDPVRVTDYLVRLQRTSHELTTEELHNLSRLLEQCVRMSEGLVEYAIAIAERPRVN